MTEKRTRLGKISPANNSSTGKISRARTVRELARRLEKMETGRRAGSGPAVIATGIPAIDALLPDGGFCNGTLVEWLADSAATGVDLLAMLSLRSVWQAGGTIVVLDRERHVLSAGSHRVGNFAAANDCRAAPERGRGVVGARAVSAIGGRGGGVVPARTRDEPRAQAVAIGRGAGRGVGSVVASVVGAASRHGATFS